MAAGDVDLNLLRVLDALLEEGSVVGAAERLHLSAPAVSRSLGRLRRALEDPLFVRSGRELVPTPRAVAMRDDVHRALAEVTAVLTPDEQQFDPSRLERRFVISAADAMIAVVGLGLVDRIKALAPGVQMDFLPDTNEVELIRSGTVDLDIGAPHAAAPEIETQVLFTEQLVAVIREAHPLAGANLTVRRFAGAQHVDVSATGKRTRLIDAALDDLGYERKDVMVVPSFVVAAHLVVDSNAVTVLPATLVASLGRYLPLVALPLPIDMPSLPVGQSWHRRNSNDPAHKWLREQVADLAG